MSATIEQIKEDLKGLKMEGEFPSEVEISWDGTSVGASFKGVGLWIHDEERGRECEADGDEDWREDDDNMIWAPGEYRKHMDKFIEWARNFKWFKEVTLNVNTSEKNWASFSIALKK